MESYNLANIGSGNGLVPSHYLNCQAIAWTDID